MSFVPEETKQPEPKRTVELYSASADVETSWVGGRPLARAPRAPRRWSGTTAHTAVLLSAGTAQGARTGLEFTSAAGERVMVFPGANDTLIVTAEK